MLKQRLLWVFTIAILFTGIFFAMDRQVMAAENVTLGSKGQEVKILQTALNDKNYWCGEANGLFGPRTYNALIRYQKDHKMVVNGHVDSALKKVLGMLPVKQEPVPKKTQTAEKQVNSQNTKGQTNTNTQTNTENRQNVSRGSRKVITLVATGYTADPAENWPYAGAPSYIGLPLARGIAAVDPNVIPMGTKLYVEGYGEAIAADQGGAIKGNRIDLFFDSKWEANTWGMKTVKVTILN